MRLGDPEAFGVLYARHAPATTAMARYYARDDFTADDLVSEAFERTYATLRGGGGPDVSFRAYVYTAVRRLAYENTEKGRRTHVTDDFSAWEMPEEVTDPAVDAFENTLVASAFSSLPERWQAVLWYVEVEGMRPPDVAPLLGLTANGVSALAYRAREGLREAYLQSHITSDAHSVECDQLRGKLGAYVNGTLSPRDARKVEAHVADCAECAAIVRELRDEGHGLRAILGPLILGGAAAAGLLAAARPSVATAAAIAPVRHFSRPAVVATAAAGALVAVAAIATIVSLSMTPTAAPETAPVTSSSASPSPTRTPTATPTPTPTTPAPTTPPSSAPTTPPTVPAPDPGPSTPPTKPTPTPTPTPTFEVPASVGVEVQDVGDLVLGRDGMVGATVTVKDADADDVTLRLELPAGVAYDAKRSLTAGAPWTCTTTESAVECSAPAVRAGSTDTLFVPVTVSSSAGIGSTAAATVTARNAPASTAAAGAAVVADGLGTRFLADGRYGTSLSGASFLSCDVALDGCAEARARTGDPARWDNGSWNLVTVDEVGEGHVSAVSQVDIPAGATVAFAGLYWSAVTPSGASDAQLGSLVLSAPGGADSAITAERVDHSVFASLDRYQAFADVTSIVAAGGSGLWSASDPQIGPSFSTPVGSVVASNSHAGWSLVVVYQDPAEVDGRVTVFDGFQVVNETAASFAVAGLPGRDVEVGVVAWEGDANLIGDGVSLDEAVLTRAQGPSDPANVFTSYAEGAAVENTFGVDVGYFLPVPLTHSRALVTASTAGDQYAIGAVTVSTR